MAAGIGTEAAIKRMEQSLADFQRDIDKSKKVFTHDQVLQVLKKIAFEGLRRITLKTAVDTGRARGNWQVTIGSPPEFSLRVTDKNGQKTISKGKGVIQSLSNPFGSIWITNNVVYILPLESGTSQQAPAGMVAVTLQELRTIFARPKPTAGAA